MLDLAADRGQPLQLWSKTLRAKPNNATVNAPKCNGTLQEDPPHPLEPWDSLPQYSAKSRNDPGTSQHRWQTRGLTPASELTRDSTSTHTPACFYLPSHTLKLTRRYGAQSNKRTEFNCSLNPSSPQETPSLPPRFSNRSPFGPAPPLEPPPALARPPPHPLPPPTMTPGPPHCTANALPATSPSSPSPAEAPEGNPQTSASTCLGLMLVPWRHHPGELGAPAPSLTKGNLQPYWPANPLSALLPPAPPTTNHPPMPPAAPPPPPWVIPPAVSDAPTNPTPPMPTPSPLAPKCPTPTAAPLSPSVLCPDPPISVRAPPLMLSMLSSKPPPADIGKP
ncbi:hypothetical protein E4T56_gene16013 [Termitomyces sp. T112]|nr:hypothetical protein E4T56_gene16013 [Termitomyces sp. T112]